MIFSGISYAGAPAPEGFRTLKAFVKALDEMPSDRFVKLASRTPMSTLQEYREALLQMDPKRFSAWNEKLRLIPGPGFQKNSNYWEVHERGPEVTVGFHPEPKPGAFSSSRDFYESALNDEVAVFQNRATQTPAEPLERWLAAVEKKNPDLHFQILLRLQVMRVVGFQPDQEYRLIQGAEGEPAAVGFKAGEGVDAKPFTVKSSAELAQAVDTLSPEDLLRLLRNMSEAQANRLLNALKKRDPQKFVELVRKVRSRTRIGFRTTGEPEVIPAPRKDAPAPAPVGFRLSSPPCTDYLLPDAA